MKALILISLVFVSQAFADRTKLGYLSEYYSTPGVTRSSTEYLNLANIAWSLSLAEVSKEFLNAVVDNPAASKVDLARAHLYFAVIAFQDKDYSGAKTHAEISKGFNTTTEAEILIGQSLAELGLYNEAISHFNTVDDDEARLSRAKLLLDKERFDEAKDTLIEISSESEFAAPALEALIEHSWRTDDYSGVATWFELLEEQNAQMRPQIASHAVLSHLKQGQQSSARATYKRYKELFEASPVWDLIVRASLLQQ